MAMPGRTFSATTQYRYGFNGKEDDNETGYQDFGGRLYAPLTGRFLTPDRMKQDYPSQSPYAFAANNPILLIDFNGDGPKKPIDPTLEGRLSRVVPSYVDVLIRCNNASLLSFESYAWASAYSSNKNDARSNKYLGLSGEAVVSDYLGNLARGVREVENPNDKWGKPHANPVNHILPHISSFVTIGGWDDDKSIDIIYSLKLGGPNRLGINMPFNDASGRPINEKGGGEVFGGGLNTKLVNFVIEVKTGTTIQNFERGFTQAASKAKGVLGGVAVVALDDDAYKDAIKESPGLIGVAQKFIKDGGRLMLINGLNKVAASKLDDAIKTVQQGTNPMTLPSQKNRPDGN